MKHSAIASDSVETPAKPRIRALSVHNVLSQTNIPVENFLKLNPDEFSLDVLTFYQTQEDAGRFLASTYPEVQAQVHGLDWSHGRAAAIVKLACILRDRAPDVVHVNHTLSAVVTALATRLLTRAKVVTTIHREFSTFSRAHRMFLLLAICLSHAVVCNSEQTLRRLAIWRRLLRWKDFRVCYNGVDLGRIKSAAIVDQGIREHKLQTLPPQRFVIGTISRLIGLKDLPTLLQGFARFAADHPNAELVIAGDGPKREELQQIARQLHISDRVKFLGSLSRSEVYRLLTTLDVFAVTSISEGFCNALVEAMAARLAIVASDIATFQEVLGSQCGAFFPVGDSHALSDCFAHLHRDVDARRTLGSAAQQRARNHFALEVSVRSYSACYREMLGDRLRRVA